MRVVVRTDASCIIGSGHIMRCLTLANALREQGADTTFICREHDGHLFNLIESSNHRLLHLPFSAVSPEGKLAHANWLGVTQEEDAQQTLEALKTIGHVDWLIIDHYALDVEWETAMRSCTERVMVIDDLADRVHDCDLLLDQNLHRADIETRYEKLIPHHCKKLFGPKYALLRPEFKDARSRLKVRDGSVKRIFIFFGGNDPTNETGKALRAIQQLGRPDIAIDVVVGSTNPHREEVTSLCAQLPNATLHCLVSNMAELMTRADIAIGAGGGTMWERCSLGLPTIVVSIAENQQSGCKAMARLGAVLYLGESESVREKLLEGALRLVLSSSELLACMSEKGGAIVDGRGGERVCGELVSKPLKVRLANEYDCEPIFQWRNHEKTRKCFFNTAPITWKDHRNWFFQKLKSAECALLVGVVNDNPVGVLRYDLEKSHAVVSVYLVPDKHGFGYGTALLRQGEEWMRANHPEIPELIAEVLTANEPSMQTFSKVGFESYMMSLKKILK